MLCDRIYLRTVPDQLYIRKDARHRHKGARIGKCGTTNMLRTLGTKAGLITFARGCSQDHSAVLICLAIFYRRDVNPEELQIIKLYASAGAILGHDFPFYLNFKGGKGIACTAGMIIALDPYMVLIGCHHFLRHLLYDPLCVAGLHHACIWHFS